MADKTISVTVYSKRNYDYNGLVSSNPILALKEFVIIKTIDNSGNEYCAYKVGDGATKFKDLKGRKAENNWGGGIGIAKTFQLSNTSTGVNIAAATDLTQVMNPRVIKEGEN